MIDLREKIARQILWLRAPRQELGLTDPEWECADRILAIPDIKIALTYSPKCGGYQDITTKDGGRRFVSIEPKATSK